LINDRLAKTIRINWFTAEAILISRNRLLHCRQRAANRRKPGTVDIAAQLAPRRHQQQYMRTDDRVGGIRANVTLSPLPLRQA
jgi:hypothetical protein